MHPAEENEVNKVVLATDFIENLVFRKVNNAARNEHFFKGVDLKFHENWVFLVQDYVGNINRTMSLLTEFLFKLKETILDLTLNILRKFALIAY